MTQPNYKELIEDAKKWAKITVDEDPIIEHEEQTLYAHLAVAIETLEARAIAAEAACARKDAALEALIAASDQIQRTIKGCIGPR